MKQLFSISMLIAFLFFSCSALFGSEYSEPEIAGDTISDESKKEARKQEKHSLKHSHKRVFIKVSAVYAKLRTKGTFSRPNGIFSATLSLEDNLGLPDNRFFYTGSFMYRFTPRSGLYAEYYGLNRNENHTTDQEYIFMQDTIPVGTSGNSYFNTQVFSVGYLLSILSDPDAFLGAYFNLYGMFIETGFSVDKTEVNPDFTFLAPLPSFGLVAVFKLNKWLQIHGDVGFFNLQLSTFGGSMYTFDVALDFKPAKWLGIALSYQEFDVNVFIPSDEVNTTIDYNFRGPALGLTFMF